MEWEAGDAKRSRAAGVTQRRGADEAGEGARRKADGTLDRRFKANRGAALPLRGGGRHTSGGPPRKEQRKKNRLLTLERGGEASRRTRQ